MYKPLSLTSIMPFGRYKGKKVVDIAVDNPHYFIALIEKMKNFRMYSPDEKYIREIAKIKDHNHIMKAAYGGLNRNCSWGLSENDVQ